MGKRRERSKVKNILKKKQLKWQDILELIYTLSLLKNPARLNLKHKLNNFSFVVTVATFLVAALIGVELLLLLLLLFLM